MNPAEATEILRKTPLFRFLGFYLIDVGEDEVVGALPFSERFIGNANNFHGGVVAISMEAVASVVVWKGLVGPEPKPINLTIDYLRPAVDETLHVRATVTRKGRRMASVEAVSWQSDPGRPAARGLFHFLLVE